MQIHEAHAEYYVAVSNAPLTTLLNDFVKVMFELLVSIGTG